MRMVGASWFLVQVIAVAAAASAPICFAESNFIMKANYPGKTMSKPPSAISFIVKSFTAVDMESTTKGRKYQPAWVRDASLRAAKECLIYGKLFQQGGKRMILQEML